jgi:hypothetical protein
VLLGGVVVRSLGRAAFFPMAGGLLLVAILVGLTRREWRELGAGSPVPMPSEG